MNVFVKNSSGEKIAILVEGLENKNHKKLAFVQHGLSGHKGQSMVRQPTRAFLDNRFVVVTFDSRYSFGDSDGELEKATLTSFIEDLNAVINWAKTQDFYVEPFALSGHSLGGASVLKYAQDHPHMVSSLVPVAAMVGGKYFIRSRLLNDGVNYRKWQREGKELRQIKDRKGYVSFNVVKDMMNYDLVRGASKIVSSTLIVTGENDLSSTIYNNDCLFYNIYAPKEFAILENCAHLYESKQNQQDLYSIIKNWLEKNV